MESFYQESGRAGRDQLPSRSILYYGLDDRKKMEFILRNATIKKRESSSPSSGLPEKSLAAFTQMVEYCEGSGCRRGKILQSFGEQVSTSLCQKSCDSCKQPSIVVQHLKDLEGKTYSQKDKFFPILTKSSTYISLEGQHTEFWNREDDDSFFEEEISDSGDEADISANIVMSRMSTDATLDKKFEILQRAEEAYFQNIGQRKQMLYATFTFTNGSNIISVIQ
ncbi:ATP-dependent DNA helicase Q-like 3 [Curcuma longa]|uniref:ATP-dependent DNA helicase Q-like 3 n=1 Tax=Curcuma longa TaxID=136217 RepID=UPI003D9E10F7